MRLLFADDDDDVRFVLSQLLTLEGWDVVGVASGTEALAKLETESFDVAVLDLYMPELSGLDVARLRRGAGDTTPLWIWTGMSIALVEKDLDGVDVELIEKSNVDALRTKLASLRGPV